MKNPASAILTGVAAVVATALASPSVAALKPGQPAPPIHVQAALAGKPFTFDMAEALKNGPVVLYFFPKAFTSGCTIEANAFAEAMPRFEAAGARVIGVSHDDFDSIRRFSTEACRDRFPVGSDPAAAVIRAYDAGFASNPDMADRISYVIGRDGRITFVHQGSDPHEHVKRTLAAVESLNTTRLPLENAAEGPKSASPR